ncbi:MAG: YlxR family protein [Deltaproteobacteria bacterium]|nr:YlxR family protein [Deltaproteobacteria bacterium]
MPSRTCLSCRKVSDKKDLVRLAAPGGVLTADVKGILPGRGAYLCPRLSCVRNAYKKKEQFSRALKRNVSLMPLEEFLDQVLKHLTIGQAANKT